jgi:predicted Fe-S protein YdhL (DUF1289 family)
MALPPSRTEAAPPAVESPCIGICQLDAGSVCLGCGRQMAEIVEWPRAAPARQLEIRRLARQRLAGPSTGNLP